MRAAAAAFRREAQGLLAACGARWPAEFDDAVRRYRQAELGWAD